MTPRIAVFVDGDNMGASHAPDILKIAKRMGTVEVARAYGDATRGSGWHTAAGYRFVHAGTGKNATDLLLCIEAMEVALAEVYQVVVVATSDGDFTHLALRLRERGITAVGVGEAKAPKAFRAACSVFECLAVAKSAVPSAPKLPCTAGPADAAPSQLDLRIRAILADSCKHGRGMRIAALGAQIHKNCGVRISTLPEKTWRAYLNKRGRLYDLDPKGPEAKVRIKPEGFADAT